MLQPPPRALACCRTESSRLHPRTQDCKEIASHDIVSPAARPRLQRKGAASCRLLLARPGARCQPPATPACPPCPAQVLTTFQNASTLHTLSHIYWWRIVADEPQLNAGGFLADRDHPWFAQHRWLLTGTPVNATGARTRPRQPSSRGAAAAGGCRCRIKSRC